MHSSTSPLADLRTLHTEGLDFGHAPDDDMATSRDPDFLDSDPNHEFLDSSSTAQNEHTHRWHDDFGPHAEGGDEQHGGMQDEEGGGYVGLVSPPHHRGASYAAEVEEQMEQLLDERHEAKSHLEDEAGGDASATGVLGDLSSSSSSSPSPSPTADVDTTPSVMFSPLDSYTSSPLARQALTRAGGEGGSFLRQDHATGHVHALTTDTMGLGLDLVSPSLTELSSTSSISGVTRESSMYGRGDLARAQDDDDALQQRSFRDDGRVVAPFPTPELHGQAGDTSHLSSAAIAEPSVFYTAPPSDAHTEDDGHVQHASGRSLLMPPMDTDASQLLLPSGSSLDMPTTSTSDVHHAHRTSTFLISGRRQPDDAFVPQRGEESADANAGEGIHEQHAVDDEHEARRAVMMYPASTLIPSGNSGAHSDAHGYVGGAASSVMSGRRDADDVGEAMQAQASVPESASPAHFAPDTRSYESVHDVQRAQQASLSPGRHAVLGRGGEGEHDQTRERAASLNEDADVIRLVLVVLHEHVLHGGLSRALISFDFDRLGADTSVISRSLVHSCQDLKSMLVDDTCIPMFTAFLES
ncbi:MAG: hypothetical protein EOO65_03545, partial [Methanosarcinales archaeon]